MKDKLLDLTTRLIEIKSETGNTTELKKTLSEAAQELKDFTVEHFEHNNLPSDLYYVGSSRPKRFKVILNAHLDVVPGRPDQFKIKTEGDKLYARGANDMKAAAAAQILVFKELAQKLSYPVGLQLVTDEEVGGFAGVKHQIDSGVLCDFVIAGEPTDMGINNEAKGILWVKLTAKGKRSHGAYPWNGDNALHRLNNALDGLFKEFPVPQKEIWATTINLSNIGTDNTTYNIVPDTAFAQLDIRFIPKDAKTILGRVKKLLPKKITIEVVQHEPEQFTDKSDTYIQQLSQVIHDVTGKKAEIIVKHGGADVRFYTVAGAAGITFGPVGAGLHSDTEWVSIKSLEQYYEVLKQFLLALNQLSQ